MYKNKKNIRDYSVVSRNIVEISPFSRNDVQVFKEDEVFGGGEASSKYLTLSIKRSVIPNAVRNLPLFAATFSLSPLQLYNRWISMNYKLLNL